MVLSPFAHIPFLYIETMGQWMYCQGTVIESSTWNAAAHVILQKESQSSERSVTAKSPRWVTITDSLPNPGSKTTEGLETFCFNHGLWMPTIILPNTSATPYSTSQHTGVNGIAPQSKTHPFYSVPCYSL